MATLPPDPFVPDQIGEPDDAPWPGEEPKSLPGTENPEPEVSELGEPGDAPT